MRDLGSASEALELYEKALELAKEDDDQTCWILESKANCLASLKRFAEALAIYEQLLKKDLDQLSLDHLQDGYEDVQWAAREEEAAELRLELKNAAEWTVHFFAKISPSVELTYTVASIGAIDDFVEALRKKEHEAWKYIDFDIEKALIAFGSYIGETIINSDIEAFWQVDIDDPESMINAQIEILDYPTTLSPIQKVMKRYQNGKEEDLYLYVKMALGEFTVR